MISKEKLSLQVTVKLGGINVDQSTCWSLTLLTHVEMVVVIVYY
jgi:hypothetical protein